jgi:hypothetical protein
MFTSINIADTAVNIMDHDGVDLPLSVLLTADGIQFFLLVTRSELFGAPITKAEKIMSEIRLNYVKTVPKTVEIPDSKRSVPHSTKSDIRKSSGSKPKEKKRVSKKSTDQKLPTTKPLRPLQNTNEKSFVEEILPPTVVLRHLSDSKEQEELSEHHLLPEITNIPEEPKELDPTESTGEEFEQNLDFHDELEDVSEEDFSTDEEKEELTEEDDETEEDETEEESVEEKDVDFSLDESVEQTADEILVDNPKSYTSSFSSIWEFGKHIDLIKSIHSASNSTNTPSSTLGSDNSPSNPPGFESKSQAGEISFAENRSSSRFLGYFKREEQSAPKPTQPSNNDIHQNSPSFAPSSPEIEIEPQPAPSLHLKTRSFPSSTSGPIRHASTLSREPNGATANGYNWRGGQSVPVRRLSSSMTVPHNHSEYGAGYNSPSSNFYSPSYSSTRAPPPRSSFFASNATMMMNSDNPYAPPPSMRRSTAIPQKTTYYYSATVPRGSSQDGYNYQPENTNDLDSSSNQGGKSPMNNNSNFNEKRYF